MSLRELPPSSPFAGDDGSADPRLAAVLAAHGAGSATLPDVVVALTSARVLVPVLAELEVAGTVGHDEHEGDGHELGHDGHELVVDKQASAGIVALRAPDGRTALPMFSSVATMTAWRPDARPVPSDVPRAARSALGEGWEVLVLDAGGPVTVLVPRPAVVALAHGEQWRPAVTVGGVDPLVRDAVAAALARVPEVARADVERGRRAEVAVVLAVVPGLDRAGLDSVLTRVNVALAASGEIATRVDSLELRLTTAR